MIRQLKTPITLLVLISILSFNFFPPFLANAQQVGAQSVSSTLIGGLSCTTGGVLSQWLVSKIVTGIKSLAHQLLKQAGSFFKLGSFLYDTVVPIGDNLNDNREGVLDIAARCFARQILNDITARMIGSVRTSGRDAGNCTSSNPLARRNCPSFVRDWRRFMANAQHRGENIFRSVINSSSLCNNVLNLKNVFNANNEPEIKERDRTRVGNLNTFQERIRCTMPQGWTLQKYTNDFAGNGSWDALTRLAEPQNNYYGALLLSLGELAAQRAHEESSDAQEAKAGNGFTSRRGKPGNNCLVLSNNGRCVIYKDILTPGSVLSNAVYATINEELAWITNVDEWQELIAYVMKTMMTRILNLAEPSDYDQEVFPREKPLITPYNDDDFSGVSPFTGLPPIPPMPPTGSVTVCTDINYGGVCETLSADDPDFANNLVQGVIMNDAISSILVPPGTTAVLYMHSNYGGLFSNGTAASFTNTTSYNHDFTLIAASINNQASSIKIIVPPPPPPPSPTPIPLPAYGITLQTSGGQLVSTADPSSSANLSLYYSLGYLAVVGYPLNLTDFVLYDVNGGTLDSGDAVLIQNQFGYYFNAFAGGGSTLAADAWQLSNSEAFTIIKASGASGPISNRELVNFTSFSGHYMVAENGGNDLVNINRTTAGSWETFTLNIITTSPTIPAPAQPECNDGWDNDSDGQTDYTNDTDCVDIFDDDESL